MRLKKKLLSFLLLSQFTIISANNLTSCLKKFEKIDQVRVNDIKSVVALENDVTSEYLIRNDSITLLVTDSANIVKSFNDFVTETSSLIYYLPIEIYNKIIIDLQLPSFSQYTEVADRGNLLFINKGSLVNSNFIVDSYNDIPLYDIYFNNVEESTLKYLNIDVTNTKNITFNDNVELPLNYSNDETNLNLIYNKNGEVSSSNILNRLPNEESIIYFSRKTCGDCNVVNEELVKNYVNNLDNKDIYILDMFIFYYPGYEKELEDFNKFKLLDSLCASNYNYHYDIESGKIVKNKDKTFVFPTFVKYKNKVKEKSIVIRNDTIDEIDGTYYLIGSYHENLIEQKLNSKSRETLEKKIKKYQYDEFYKFVS